MISFVVIEFVLLEDLFITNLVIYQYIPFFFLFSIPKITPINGKNQIFLLLGLVFSFLHLKFQNNPHALLKGRSKSIQKISSVLKENFCLSDTISGELASVYQEVFSDENKKSWEDNKNSGLDYFLEMELDISWEGDSTWECSQGAENCHYSAEIKVAPLKDSLNTSLIDDLLKENPFITDEEIADVYENDLNDYLDKVFSDYCEGDDYYPPNTEDFEIEYYVGKWCQKNGFKLRSANGDGYEDDFEAWSRRY